MPNTSPRKMVRSVALLALLYLMTSSGATQTPIHIQRVLAKENTDFGLRLNSYLFKDAANDDNIFFSPYSISVAMAMAYAGASGTTRDTIGHVLGFDQVDDLHQAFKDISDNLTKDAKNFTLRLANRMFSQIRYTFSPDYQYLLATHYHAPVERLNFATDPDLSREIINDWVERVTENKITDLLQPGTITPRTIMVLVNAIYFKGTWLKRFESNQTRPRQFFVTPTESVMVDMMFAEGEFQYGAGPNDSYKIIELPYHGKKVSMYVILPAVGTDLKNFTATLRASDVTSAISTMFTAKTRVQLPKFKIIRDFKLKDTLEKMGLNGALSGSSDFSGMSDSAIEFDEIVHKAFIEVTEKGTEAAAATGVIRSRSYVPYRDFIVNRPFLFMIFEKRTQTALFLGTIQRPTAATPVTTPATSTSTPPSSTTSKPTSQRPTTRQPATSTETAMSTDRTTESQRMTTESPDLP